MANLVELALGKLPTTIRADAAQAITMTAAGYGPREIGSSMGITWRAVNDLRTQAADGLVSVLRDDGYADVEIINLLRVPTAAVVPSPPLAGRNS